MENNIKQILLDNAGELFGTPVNESMIQLQKTRKEFKGDITLVIFPFVKMMKTSPDQAAERIGNFLRDHLDLIRGFNVVKGFLNLEIDDVYWLKTLQDIDADESFGLAKEPTGKTLMVEYSSPNTNKPLHLGHLRNNFLGYSVAEILKANGNKVIKTQIINDRGIHICKSMLAWLKFAPLNAAGERETPQTTGMKGDKFVGKYYVEFDKALNAEAKEIMTAWEKSDFSTGDQVAEEVTKLYAAAAEKEDEKAKQAILSKVKELAKNETSILKEAKEMLVKWEARDPETYLLWTTMNSWVYDGFDTTYKTMGVDFDHLYYESDTFLFGKDVVIDGLNKGIFYRKEDGSVWIDLTDEGLDEKLVLRSDGTAVYMTQDIGTAIERFKDYPDLNGIIYTVGNEQDYHFKVLFLILKKLGYTWADECFHLSYGMVDLPTGKMKSREGTVVDADDLMHEVIQAASEMTRERGHIEGMSEEEKQELFKMIGLGGLKYYLLKVDPRKRMMFNPEESIELNGNTGPFLQYAYARIQSLVAKTGLLKAPEKSVITEEERELIKWLMMYPSTVEEAGKNYSPAEIANYTFELVKMYNAFYQSVPPIVKETNEEVKQLRVALSLNVAKVVKSAMRLLGIDVPQRM
ncbi:arginine--tRNA ligase [Wandonia haliotis]|uniref:Arginine--tRNA ligase n=1 Tax=Wandonia haliotis TaxID=574963 RepID=A0ABP3Y5Q5_9FLAO